MWRVKITALFSGSLQVLQTLPLRCTGLPTSHLHRAVLQALKLRALCGTGAEHDHTMSVRRKAEPEECAPICSKKSILSSFSWALLMSVRNNPLSKSSFRICLRCHGEISLQWLLRKKSIGSPESLAGHPSTL